MSAGRVAAGFLRTGCLHISAAGLPARARLHPRPALVHVNSCETRFDCNTLHRTHRKKRFRVLTFEDGKLAKIQHVVQEVGAGAWGHLVATFRGPSDAHARLLLSPGGISASLRLPADPCMHAPMLAWPLHCAGGQPQRGLLSGAWRLLAL